MAISNRDRVGRALDQLRDGLLPYISRELYQGIGSNWQEGLAPNTSLQDVSVLLKLIRWSIGMRCSSGCSARRIVPM